MELHLVNGMADICGERTYLWLADAVICPETGETVCNAGAILDQSGVEYLVHELAIDIVKVASRPTLDAPFSVRLNDYLRRHTVLRPKTLHCALTGRPFNVLTDQ